MISGSFESDTEFEPRMRMREPAPVVPLASCTVTPAARDESTVVRFVTAACGTCSGTLMLAVETPLSRRDCSCPVAVIWTTSSCVAAVSRVKSSSAACPATTVIGRELDP